MITNKIEMLLKLRSYLIESIAEASNKIKEIDIEIDSLKLEGLEDDLIQAERAQA